MIVAFYSEASFTGKDTCADAAASWCRAHGVLCQRDAFAWDGKVVCADALGIEGTREEKVAAIDRIKLHGVVEWAHGPGRRKRGGSTGRNFIIGLLGDPQKKNGVRGLDEEFWTNLVVRRAARFTGFTVVSDMRFVSEAEAVNNEDGWVVEVVRPGSTYINEERVPTDLVNFTVVNDGSIERTQQRVWEIMDEINRVALVGRH